MRAEILPSHAATLQCVAAALREEATGGVGVRSVELRRFATVLDHMAASLLLPPIPALAVVTGIKVEEEVGPMRLATSVRCSDQIG